MKLSTAVLVALFAATAQGFSVTMSSIGYLDKLSTGSVTFPSYGSSSAPAPMPYSPPSYGAPAPAPASYTSIFAGAAENKDLNYIKTLGGGNNMKGGSNFAGVASSYKAVSNGANYLDALKGKVFETSSYEAQSWSAPAPSPMPYSAPSSYSAPAPAPASAPSNGLSANGNYLANLNAGPVSNSYNSNSYSNAKPQSGRSAFGGYLNNL